MILPVVPNRDYAWGALNPFNTWLMVVLIVGISLGAYIVYKFWGQSAGVILGGVLGGTISSTATTVSYARISARGQMAIEAAGVAIMLASTVVFARVLVEIAIVCAPMLALAGPPIVVLALATLVPSLVWLRRIGSDSSGMPEPKNPTQLTSALLFACIYTLVGLALAISRDHLGGQGLYAAAFISGLSDMDAVTLSTARMATQDANMLAQGWRLIVTAALANMGFKAGLAGFLGGWRLLRLLASLYAIPILAGILLLALWPV